MGGLLAAAVSDDGRYLAVGGGDKAVHIFDARSAEYIKVCAGGGGPCCAGHLEGIYTSLTACLQVVCCPPLLCMLGMLCMVIAHALT